LKSWRRIPSAKSVVIEEMGLALEKRRHVQKAEGLGLR
jgi:hypothetical protein